MRRLLSIIVLGGLIVGCSGGESGTVQPNTQHASPGARRAHQSARPVSP